MKIFGLGIPELLIILVVILLIFGPKNLPKLGSAIGRAVKGLREGMGSNANKTTQAAPAEGVVEDVVVEDVDKLNSSEPASATAAAAGAVNANAAAPKTVKRVVKKKVS